MTPAELRDAARRSGAVGETWTKFTYDYSEAVCDSVDRGEVDLEDVRASFDAGMREHREKSWISIWTTASERYDFLGTFTVEGPYPWDGKQLRRALLDPEYVAAQRARYWSGLCGDWDEDPRATEARIKWELSRERVDRIMLGFRVAAGHAWLASLSDEELAVADRDEDDFYDAVRGFGVEWDAISRERERRADVKAAAERAAEWARCRAAFPDGATLIDEGMPGIQGFYGWIKGRDKDAWRGVKVEPHYACKDDADQARVVGEGPTLAGTYVGSLAYVAGRIEAGEMRLARPDEHVPPRAVLARIGRPFNEVLRVEIDGRAAWVGSHYGLEPLVLDDAGKIVRAKKIREAAERAYWDRYFGRSRAEGSTG